MRIAFISILIVFELGLMLLLWNVLTVPRQSEARAFQQWKETGTSEAEQAFLAEKRKYHHLAAVEFVVLAGNTWLLFHVVRRPKVTA